MEISITSKYFVPVKKNSPEYTLGLMELVNKPEPEEEITWKTKDGIEIPLSKMSDSHLINTYSLVRNMNKEFPFHYNGKGRTQWLVIFSSEMIRRGLI